MLLELFVRVAIAITIIILLVRLNGLRSFSKMAGFDFALTVAIGSILAYVMTSTGSPIWIGPVILVFLFGLRFGVAKLRKDNPWAEQWLDNDPVFLMYDGEVLSENLAKTRVTEAELMAKLREANALDMRSVQAVILEATGDVSVLHGDAQLSDCLLEGVSWGDAVPRQKA